MLYKRLVRHPIRLQVLGIFIILSSSCVLLIIYSSTYFDNVDTLQELLKITILFALNITGAFFPVILFLFNTISKI